MVTPSLMKEILSLSPAERIKLVEDIWDSLAASPESMPLTDEERRILDERLKAHRENPDAAIPWEEVKARILGKA